MKKHGALGVIMLSAVGVLGVSTFAIAQEDVKPPMHMHKSEMDHSKRSDAEVAAEYKSEATQLREKAESHKKLAKFYKGRTPPKGMANYENVAKHCEQLAASYENAATEADAVSTELSK